MKNIRVKLQEIQSHKLNIVTCGMCGDVFIHRIK